MNRVLMMGPSLSSLGGIATVQKTLLDNWETNRYAVSHIATYADNNKFSKLIIATIAAFKMIYHLCFITPDIIHIHFAADASIYRKSIFIFLANLFSVIVLVHSHAADFDTFYLEKCTYIQQNYIKKLFSKVDALAVLSKKWKSFYSLLYDHEKIKIIYNPVYYPPYINQRKEKPFKILTLGRLGKRKGTYDLIKAIPLILENEADVVFNLGGDGDLHEIQNILNEFAWGNRVNILGWISGNMKEDLLLSSSIFILPSYNEGLPVAILEAMAYGLPVISTPVGGIPEIIRHRETGILIEPGNVEQIAESVIELLNNYKLRMVLSKNARQYAKENFNIKSILEEIYDIYDSLLQ